MRISDWSSDVCSSDLGKVSEARDRLRPQVRLETRKTEGAWCTALPAGAEREDHVWHFPLPEGGVEPLLKALIEGDAGIEALAIERPGPHRSEEHTSELQSLMRISYALFRFKKKKQKVTN